MIARKLITFFIIFTTCVFTVVAQGAPPPPPPGDGNVNDIAVPIDEYLWIAFVMANGLGLYYLTSKKILVNQ